MDALDSAGIVDDTLVLVVSEMGRSPLLNALGGKDHWPFTSSMLIGPNVRPGVVRATDDTLRQVRVDLVSGDADTGGHALQTRDVLATTAQLMGVDPVALYPDGEVLDAVVA
jgi:uncharacterized protein (DUF1501 family)